MKVLLVNGSPHKNGCTNTALEIVAKTIQSEGIETEIFWIGNNLVAGCMACGKCANTGKCCFDDSVNVFAEKAKEADGFVFGSPVHYACASGQMVSFMDRLFVSSAKNTPNPLWAKPATVVTSARRAGTTSALDQLQKWLSFSEMPIVSSRYWNQVHGQTPSDVLKDEEGVQIMRVLGKNMAWIIKCINCAKDAGITKPKEEKKTFFNFIR